MAWAGKHRQFGRLVAIALIAFASAQGDAALAAPSTDPVGINDCHINSSRGYVSPYKPLAITFTNARLVAADEVRFIVEYAGKTVRVTDIGTFSRDIGIRHSFDGFYGSFYSGSQPKRCTVDSVHFADGSVWTPRPSPAPTPGRDSRT